MSEVELLTEIRDLLRKLVNLTKVEIETRPGGSTISKRANKLKS